MMTNIQQQIRDVVTYACRAPSAENNQPWSLRFTDERILELTIHRDRAALNNDSDFRMARIAVGSILENIEISAEYFGLRCESHISQDVIRIEFEPCESRRNALHDAIRDRWTNRYPFDTMRDIPESVYSDLGNIQSSRISCAWIHEDADLHTVARSLLSLGCVQFSSVTDNRYLLNNIKTLAEERRDQHGMGIRSLGLSFAHQLNMRMFKNLGMAQMMALKPIGYMTARPQYAAIHKSSSLAMLYVSGNAIDNAIEDGRCIQRFWLEATHRGLAVQPLFALPHYYTSRSDLTEKNDRIQEIYANTMKAFSCVNNPRPIILFRLGYSSRQKIPSVRMNQELFVSQAHGASNIPSKY